ncbi:hypothetical protein ANRL3_00510 [Anaerolineae bacterium]|nr:hypothetical protein ANRL3_00510 [Anaerolineae bacterium]
MSGLLINLLGCAHCQTHYLYLEVEGQSIYRHLSGEQPCLYAMQDVAAVKVETDLWLILQERFLLTDEQKHYIVGLASRDARIDSTEAYKLLGAIVSLIKDHSNVDALRVNSILRSMFKRMVLDNGAIVKVEAHPWCASLFNAPLVQDTSP